MHKLLPWAVGFFFGNTELSLELWTVIAGHIRVRRLGGDLRRLSLIVAMVTLILVMSACGSGLSEARLAYNDGVDAYDQGLNTEAISHYDKAIQLDPDYASAYINRGVSYFELGEYQTTIPDLTKAIQLNPDNTSAYINRGVSYHELGEYQDAIPDYSKAIQLDPDYADAYYNRGVTFRILGNNALASEDFNKTCEVDRSNC